MKIILGAFITLLLAAGLVAAFAAVLWWLVPIAFLVSLSFPQAVALAVLIGIGVALLK
jgi:hypothetical protein